MPNMKRIQEGLTILAKYADENEYLSAEHDILYGPVIKDGAEISEEDAKKLDELGWHVDSLTNSWAAFV